ncbi:hydantoinase/oxoprolinase family protein, partial [Rhizobiaceae sp. 2RAB30]
MDGATGALSIYKEPSVPSDPSASVKRGLPRLLERAGKTAADVNLVVHGTTIGLNAVIQRRGARMGLVVSRGLRGVLEIGRAQMPNAFSFALQKEEPLVPRRLVLESGVRILGNGSLFSEGAPNEVERMAETFAAADVEAVTVLLIHSYRRPEVEQALADALGRRLPGIPVTASASIWPEQREFERGMVALMNAYVQPIMLDYLNKLEARMAGLGVVAPIYITANNGGTLSLSTARTRPVDTLLSGPASGVVAAATVARATGIDNIVTVDMGGTSADMSVVTRGDPENTNRTTIGDFPIIVPVVNVSAIGAGGGSIVWVDPHGILKIGPASAGASPGPVCYGRGGVNATVTDCYLITGFIDPDRFLGGRMRLDVEAARKALDIIGEKIGLTAGPHRAAQAAEAALRVTTALMAAEMSKGIAQRGEDLKSYSLLPFGGAGPTQANLLAEGSGIKRFIVPGRPGTFCALGAILADVKRDYVRSQHFDLTKDPEAARLLADLLSGLEEEAREWIAQEGDLLVSHDTEVSADIRYNGQAFDLPVRIACNEDRSIDVGTTIEQFHQAHERIYHFRDPDTAVEITTVRLRVTGKVAPINLAGGHDAAQRPTADHPPRRLYWQGGYRDAPVIERSSLRPSDTFSGPVIIEQEDTT